jgi:hypothetical protein
VHKREDLTKIIRFPHNKVDVHQNIITNSMGQFVAVYDLETKKQCEIKCVGQRTGRTRRLKDTLYITSDAGVELFSLHDNVRFKHIIFPFMVIIF